MMYVNVETESCACSFEDELHINDKYLISRSGLNMFAVFGCSLFLWFVGSPCADPDDGGGGGGAGDPDPP